MPDVLLGDFINAIADVYNLDLVPDVATRTLRMDYRENVLLEAEVRTTDHSHRLVNDVEIDHQRGEKGMRLHWDLEDNNAEPDAYNFVAEVVTENDLPTPYSTGQRILVRSTRAVFKSLFREGYFAWEQQGYHVPDVLVGQASGAREVKPAFIPLHMKQEELDGKQYLMPVLNELGTSAWFHTEGDRSKMYLCEYKEHRSADGTVTDVPSARSWGVGWDLDDRSKSTLEWYQDDEDMPGTYQSHWRNWLDMLLGSEPVTLDLLVDTPFLKGTDWHNILQMHGQRYVLETLPVVYGSSRGQMVSTAAYARRFRALAVERVPFDVVPQPVVAFSFQSDKSGALIVNIFTTDGHFTLLDQYTQQWTYASGFNITGFDPLGLATNYNVWPTNAQGTNVGAVTAITLQGQNITQFNAYALQSCVELILNSNADLVALDLGNMPSLIRLQVAYCTALATLDLSYCPALYSLSIPETSITAIDTSALPLLEVIDTTNCGITSFDFSNNPLLNSVVAQGCALTNTDDIINWMDASIPDGVLYLDGGTSVPRTSASDTNYDALIANGWAILTN